MGCTALQIVLCRGMPTAYVPWPMHMSHESCPAVGARCITCVNRFTCSYILVSAHAYLDASSLCVVLSMHMHMSEGRLKIILEAMHACLPQACIDDATLALTLLHKSHQVLQASDGRQHEYL